jgi:aromatic-L-amino-acid decarboxylase
MPSVPRRQSEDNTAMVSGELISQNTRKKELDNVTLDPADWESLRRQAHKMLDDMLDHTSTLRERPVWQPIPEAVRERFHGPMPSAPEELSQVHEEFMRHIVPYSIGNAHPGFMGWVQGGGTPVGMLADMLCAGLNANVGGRDQIPIEVERQVTQWVRELFSFPDTASGLFVTGTSMANLMGVWIARFSALGPQVRSAGMDAAGRSLVGYASAGAHACIMQAFDLAGLGTDALRLIPVNEHFQMDTAALRAAIARDKRDGLIPFFVAGTAGTVDTGAIDELDALAEIAAREKIWFHIDGAYGALGMLAPDIAPRLHGLSRANSVAFDFHKWGQVPYDAGFLLVRDGSAHLDTFAAPAAYLRREQRGMAANSPWPCDFGPDLSRSFRALKTWFTLKTYGAEQLGKVISGTCALARYLGARIEATPELELLAPVSLNIVCFRYRAADADNLNAMIAATLQEAGIVAPSTTIVNGKLAIRAAFVNHRTNKGDLDQLIQGTLAFGRARALA